jgi:hypothetical protein
VRDEGGAHVDMLKKCSSIAPNERECTHVENRRLFVRGRQLSHFRKFRKFFPVSLRAMPEGYGIGICRQPVFIDGRNHVAFGK